jgi:predicted permease
MSLFFDGLLEEVRVTPGVAAASVATQLPLGGGGSDSVIMPKGYTTEEGESLISPYYTIIGTGYFETMGIPLVEGRFLGESDRDGSEQVIVIDETLARRYWPDSSPVGKQMLRGVPGMDDEDRNTFTVVGVVGSVKQRSLDEDRNVGAYYISYRQRPTSFVSLVVRAAVDPTSLTEPIRRLVARLDPDLPFFGAQTMEEMIRGTMQARRSTMLLLVIFAAVALFLAAVGIYGVLAYSVTQRTRELGIRMALGSSSGRLFRMIILQGVVVAGIGLVAGLGGALLFVRLLQSLLFGVGSTEPSVLVAVGVLLAGVVLVACLIPARRATRIDPVTALHAE